MVEWSGCRARGRQLTKRSRDAGVATLAAAVLFGVVGCTSTTSGHGVPLTTGRSSGSGQAVPLAGTKWAGQYETVTSSGGDQGCPHEQLVVTLVSTGYIDYSSKCSVASEYRSYRGEDDNSRWSGTAAALKLSLNNGFTICDGRVAGDTMSGHCHNHKGEEFGFTFVRQ